ncbi:MAG: hypothetical protein Q7T88_12160 [Methylotenera sp.]|nr:hypothetical protein [Methylotenera sp.]
MMNVIIKLLTPALALHASIRCFSTNAGGEAKYWLPLKWGEKMRDIEISIPSTSRAKVFATLLMTLLIASFFTSAQAAPDDDFGRLFSRQNERKNLDIKRQNQKLKVITPQDLQPEPAANAAPPELPNPITMQGYVKRSDGASTLWINNQAVQEGSAIDNVQIGRLKGQQNKAGAGSDSLNVKIPANGQQVQLKAGQVYMPETNQIVELKAVEKAKRLNLEETGAIGDDEKSSQ